jgi:hypothetical protein
MLFKETVAVYCENHTKHTDTFRISQETYYVSATDPNRLMLFNETVAVYCENHTEHTDTFRTSQETHYVSATDPNRLMLFKETVAVYCENHTEHTDTFRTLQETHYVSATDPNRLMLFRKAVAVYSKNHADRITALRVQNSDFLNIEAGGTYCYRSGPAMQVPKLCIARSTAVISPIQHDRNHVHPLLPRVYSVVSLSDFRSQTTHCVSV